MYSIRVRGGDNDLFLQFVYVYKISPDHFLIYKLQSRSAKKTLCSSNKYFILFTNKLHIAS